MVIKIMAAHRLKADAASWFDSLSQEQQKEYLKLHPDSKYADDVKTGEKDEKPIPLRNKDIPVKKKYKHEIQKQTHPAKNIPKALPKEVEHFAHSEAAHAGSKERRSLGQMIKAKAKGIVKHLVDEVKEAGVAGHAVTKLLRGKPTTPEEQHAMKATATRLVIVIGSMAIGGGLVAAMGEGIKVVAKEIANDFLAHGLINATEKTLMHSSKSDPEPSEKSVQQGLDHMTQLMAKYMETSPNVQKILQKLPTE
jgi:hypothetical protein